MDKPLTATKVDAKISLSLHGPTHISPMVSAAKATSSSDSIVTAFPVSAWLLLVAPQA